jgi:hypothetical protein
MALPVDSTKPNGKKRVEVISDALGEIAVTMTARSTKGMIVSPRYRVAIYVYNDEVYDLLGGVQSIDQLVRDGIPELRANDAKGHTQTAKAFVEAERLLQRELPNIQHCPAPIVCHMTDGEHDNNSSPIPIVERIKRLTTQDGAVLVENIFMSDTILANPVRNVAQWSGIAPDGSDFSKGPEGDYARTLMRISSPLPSSFSEQIVNETGYALEAERPMMYPGSSIDFVRLAFTVSAGTKTTSRSYEE